MLNKVTEKHKELNLKKAENDREADINRVKIRGKDKALTMIQKIETTPYIYRDVKGMKLFDKEQGAQLKKNLKEFLDMMHQKGVYHRDV